MHYADDLQLVAVGSLKRSRSLSTMRANEASLSPLEGTADYSIRPRHQGRCGNYVEREPFGDRRSHELLIATIIRSRVSGRSRTRMPIASNTAFAIAAAVGPATASPIPSDGWSGRSMIVTSTGGASE